MILAQKPLNIRFFPILKQILQRVCFMDGYMFIRHTTSQAAKTGT